MKRAKGDSGSSGQLASQNETAREGAYVDAVDELLPDDPALDPALALAGGASMGVFLHEVLEELDFASALAPDNPAPANPAPSSSAPSSPALSNAVPSNPVKVSREGAARWLEEPERRALFRRCAVRNGVDDAELERAAAVLLNALRAPLTLGPDAVLEQGLASAREIHKELPFVHPIPEGKGAAGWATGGPHHVDRGYIKGVIDLVLLHRGRAYIVDYKSDRLRRYDPDSLSAHVAREYAVQARLYTLGTLRILGVVNEAEYDAKFGGLVYAFLRGMGEPGEGVWRHRPTWEEARAWEDALLSDAPFGMPLPRRRTAP